MSYIERPNVEACQYLLTILSADFVKKYRDSDEELTYFKIKKYLQLVMKYGEVKMDYHKSQYDTMYVLRSYSSGIQGLPKEIRGFICGDMIDYDIKNCHPTILLNLCKKHQIPCLYLQKFCEERDELYATNQIDKKLVMCCMFWGKNVKGTPFTVSFDTEMKQIQQQLKPLYEDLYEMARAKNGKNLIGTFLSYVCQYHENQIVQAVISHFHVQVAVLMFDGFMSYSQHPVEELNEYVKQRFQMDVEWIVKPHQTSLTIPDGWKSDNLEVIYENLKQKYETDYRLAYIEKTVSYSYKIRDEVCFFSKDQCSKHFDSVFVGDYLFFKKWCSDPNKQVYQDIGVYPHDVKCPEGVLNLWTGFEIEKHPTELVDIQPILDLIDILANHEKPSYEFLLDWLANMFQYPSSPSVLVALCSPNQGAGKSSLVSLIANMVGSDKHKLICEPTTDLFGHFNGDLANSVFLNIDECKRSDMIQFYDRMKTMINAPTNKVHHKGQTPFDIQNIRHYLATFNPPDSMKYTEGDRRNFFCYCSEEKIGDVEYFNALYALIGRRDVQYSFYRFLMERPVKRKFNKIDIPVTQMMLEAIVVNRDPVEDYIMQFRSGCDANDLYVEYQDFIRESGLKDPLSKKSFQMRFSRLMVKHSVTKRHLDEMIDGKRVQYVEYTRPLLLEA